MGIYIKDISKPEDCDGCLFQVFPEDRADDVCFIAGAIHTMEDCPLVEIPTPHGRLIDANKLEAMMYHEAFEIDSDMQKWDSGCWIRYKVFENCMN